jgi:hypothetical protein
LNGVLVACSHRLSSLPSPALATDVYGTGSPAHDVANVQAAVDGGGTVYLHGNFDFHGRRDERADAARNHGDPYRSDSRCRDEGWPADHSRRGQRRSLSMRPEWT